MDGAYSIKKSDLPALLARVVPLGRVYAPVREDGIATLAVIGSDQSGTAGKDRATLVAWDFPRTVVPPKEVFFPHTERLFGFRKKGKRVEIDPVADPAPVILLGARPCDMAGVEMVRRVMLEGEFRDESFEKRREAITSVTVACDQPGEHCFCTAFGGGPASSRGSDVMLFPDGERYLAQALTPNGERLIKAGGDVFSPSPAERVLAVSQRFEENAQSQAACMPSRNAVGKAAGIMEGRFDHPYWKEAAERCLGCGICTYLCPTCYCFSVVDRLRGECGTRSRCWDACMFEGYSRMAGGHNPRPTKMERVRQRFMHKLVYYPQRYRETMCVGCGRCVEKCPVGLHIAGVVEGIGGVACGK